MDTRHGEKEFKLLLKSERGGLNILAGRISGPSLRANANKIRKLKGQRENKQKISSMAAKSGF